MDDPSSSAYLVFLFPLCTKKLYLKGNNDNNTDIVTCV